MYYFYLTFVFGLVLLMPYVKGLELGFGNKIMGTKARVKFSHTGGLNGRRTRALERLQRVKEPNKEQLKQIEVLEKRIKGA